MSNNPEEPEIPLDSTAALNKVTKSVSRLQELMGELKSATNAPPKVEVSEEPKVVVSRQTKREPKFKPGLALNQGKQVVKGYSVTEDQLENLSTLGVLATACFSGSAALAGFAINLRSSLDLAVGTPRETIAWWSGVNVTTAIGAVIVFLIGVVFYGQRFSKLRKIKKSTIFNE